jgi:hypothetical protein
VLSAHVQEALQAAILSGDIEAISDAFVELYTIAQTGAVSIPMAQGIDFLVTRHLTHQTGQ